MPKRKSIKPKTREEIEVEIKRAEEFAEEHPTSMFGDDNVKKVEQFKRICNSYLNGKTLNELDEELDSDIIDDETSCDIGNILSWLRGENVTGEEHFW